MVLALMGLSTASLLGAMFTIYIRATPSRPIPNNCVRRIVLGRCVTKLFCHTRTQEREEDGVQRKSKATLERSRAYSCMDEGDEKGGGYYGVLLGELQYMTGLVQMKKRQDVIVEEWIGLAKMIDRILFWFCLAFLTLALILIYV